MISTQENSTVHAHTREKQQQFLDEYRIQGNVLRSAEAVKIHRDTVYKWLDDPDFETRFKKARKQSLLTIKDVLHDLAVGKVEKDEDCYPPDASVGRWFVSMLDEDFRDKQTIKHEVDIPLPISVVGVPSDPLDDQEKDA